MRKFSANAGSSFLAANLTSLKIVSLTHNNGSSGENFDAKFNPAIAIIIVVLLSILFFMGVFSIYIRRCIMDDDGIRPSSPENAWEENSGLERTIIESFPVFSYSLVKGLKAQAKGSECAVCLSDFDDEDMLRLLPICSHAFHPECIDMWLCSHTTCPVCRSTLLPAGQPAKTEFGVAEPQAQPEQLAIVVGGGAASGRHGSVELSNDEATDGAPGCDSMGHSLVRVRKESEQPAEWYIATAEGLTAGMHRSCSFVGMHHSQGPGGSKGEAGCRARSERWGSISVNPASFLRTFSERFAPQLAESKRFNGRSAGLV